MKLINKHRIPFVVALVFAFIAIVVVFTVGSESVAADKVKQIIDPSDKNSILYTDSDGNLAGIGGTPDNPASQALKASRAWHPDALKAEELPRDKFGLVDWAQLVRKGMISPRGSLDPEEEDGDPFDMNVRIESKSDFVNDVKYPHYMHTYWLSCEVCHDTVGGAIFQMAAGTNGITMIGISQGKWCGRCHGKVAFPLADCNRCHSVEKGAEMPMMDGPPMEE